MVGSLNSMSFLEPYRKIDNILKWFKDCQIKNIKEQYEIYNVRAFDFHIAFVETSNKAVFSYDGIKYKTFSIYEYLNYLNKNGNVYVRFLFDGNGKNKNDERHFFEYCKIIEEIYTSIKFFGGYRVCDKKQIYKFKYKEPENLIFYKRVDKLFKL